MGNAYQERIEAKRERYAGLAASKQTQASALHSRAHDMASVIPFGQPILVGHHSESRDRKFRKRIEGTFNKAFETQNTAEYYAQKAQTVGTGGISSLDPEAVTLLKAKLEKLVSDQAKMVSANKLIKKNDRAGLAALGFSEESIAKMFTPGLCDKFGLPSYATSGRLGFASFDTTNNSAEIRRIKARIEEIMKINTKAEAEPVKIEAAGYDYTEEDGRCQFSFPGKPSEEIRTLLKKNGFKWSPTRGTWVRQLTANAQRDSRWVMQNLAKTN